MADPFGFLWEEEEKREEPKKTTPPPKVKQKDPFNFLWEEEVKSNVPIETTPPLSPPIKPEPTSPTTQDPWQRYKMFPTFKELYPERKEDVTIQQLGEAIGSKDFWGGVGKDISGIPATVGAGIIQGAGSFYNLSKTIGKGALMIFQPQKQLADKMMMQPTVKKISEVTKVPEEDLYKIHEIQDYENIPTKLTSQITEHLLNRPEVKKMNPLAKQFFIAAGGLVPGLPVIKAFTGAFGAIRGFAMHGALEGLSHGDLKDASVGALGGTLTGGFLKYTHGLIRPKYIRALTEALGFGSIGKVEEGIRKGELPDITNISEEDWTNILTGLAFGLTGSKKHKLSKKEIQKIKKETVGELGKGKPVPTVSTEIKEAKERGLISKAEHDALSAEEGARYGGEANLVKINKYYETQYLGKKPDVILDPNKQEAIIQMNRDGTMEVYGSRGISHTEALRKYGDVLKKRFAYTPEDKEVKILDLDTEIDPDMKLSKYYSNFMKKGSPPEYRKYMKARDFQYQEEHNVDQMAIARQMVKLNFEGEIDKILKLKVLGSGHDSASVKAIREKFIEAKNYEDLIAFDKEVRSKATESGRAIQALDLKMSPTRIVDTTERIFEEAKEKGSSQIDKWTRSGKWKGLGVDKQLAEELIDMAVKAEALPKGREKDIMHGKIYKKIASKIPTGLLKKVSGVQTMAQLLNPKTILRNIFGNAGLLVAEAITNDLAALGERFVMGKISKGKRSVTRFQWKEFFKGMWEGFKKGKEDLELGIDTTGIEMSRRTGKQIDPLISQYEIRTGVFKKGFGKFMEKLLGYALRVPDRMFLEGTLRESVANQMKVAGLKEPTQKMIINGLSDGLYRTYQDTNRITKIFTGLKKALNAWQSFGFGDLVLKYPKTPANLFARAIDYSPFGIIKAAYGLKKGLGQRHFVRDISRTIGGSALYGLGFLLYNLGVVTGGRDESEKLRATRTAMGMRDYALNKDAFVRWLAYGMNPNVTKAVPGDSWVSFDWFQPLSNTFGMGVEVGKLIEKQGSETEIDKVANFLHVAVTSVEAGVNTLAEQPLVTGVQRMFRKKSLTKGLTDIVKSAPTSFIPTLFGQIRYAVDPIKRSIYEKEREFFPEMWNMIKNKLPFLSETLPARKDVLGKDMSILDDENKSGFSKALDVIGIFANPAIVTKYKSSPGIQFAINLYDETGETKQLPRRYETQPTIYMGGKKYTLTTEQRLRYQEIMGRKTEEAYNKVIKNRHFMSWKPEQQVEHLYKMLDRLGRQTRHQLWEEIR